MTTPHKHAALIKAWADGAEIEFYRMDKGWMGYSHGHQPNWHIETAYRIKPEPKPDYVLYGRVHPKGDASRFTTFQMVVDNLQLTFDGETRELKSAQVINKD